MTIYTFDRLPTTSGEAFVEFDDRWLAAQGITMPESWVSTYGEVMPTNSTKTTFPISQVGGIYQETRGDSRFQGMSEKSFDIKSIEYDLGYWAPMLELFQSVYAWSKWKNTSELFRVGEGNLAAEKIAALLEDGENIAGWDGVNFFATNHPANTGSSLGTWSNYQSAGKDPADVALVEAEVTAMKSVKDENGKKLRVSPDVMMVPSEKFQKVVNVLKQDLIANAAGTAAIKNGMQGILTVVENPDLEDPDDWYLIDSKIVKRLPPWASLRYLAPESLAMRRWDENSDYFKETGNLKVSSHLWQGHGLVWPHGIRKVVGA